VDRALVYEKADRWPSAVEMREALTLAMTECFGAPGSRDTLLELLPTGPGMPARFTAETEAPGAQRFAATTGPPAQKGSQLTPPHDPPRTQLSHGSQGAPPLQGTSTGSPVSSGAAAHAPMGGKVVTASAVAIAIGALLFAFQSRGKTTVVVASPPSAPSTSSVSPPPPASALPTPTASAPTSTPSPPEAPPPVMSSPSPPQSAPPVKGRAAPVRPLPSTKTTAPAQDCSLAPYWYDAKGDKHWYPECQQ